MSFVIQVKVFFKNIEIRNAKLSSSNNFQKKKNPLLIA